MIMKTFLSIYPESDKWSVSECDKSWFADDDIYQNGQTYQSFCFQQLGKIHGPIASQQTLSDE